MNKRKFFIFGAAAVMVLAAFFFFTCALDQVQMETIIHAAVPVIDTQPGVKQFAAKNAVSLTVVASSPDGGELSYQWYSFKSSMEYDSQTGEKIDGATSATFTPVVSAIEEDTVYNYYVMVTNEKPDVSGKKKVSLQSAQAAFIVTDPANAKVPFITRQPASGIYILRRGMSINLSMSAITERGDLTFQWYQTTTPTNEKGDPLEGIVSTSFSPTVGSGLNITGAGTYYFFVAVTNLDMLASGNKQRTMVSEVAQIIVQLDPDAEEPEIARNPQSKIYFVNDNADPIQSISVVAYAVEDGGTMKYQWYKSNNNPIKTDSNGNPIEVTPVGEGGLMTIAGGNGTASLTLPVTNTAASVNYFYAVVTNENSAVKRNKTASVTSNVAVISVQDKSTMVEMVDYFSTVTVNVNNPRQYVRGFGGMDVAWGNFPTYTMKDYETMYNPNQLGYNIVRIMVMPQNTDINKTMEELVGNKLTGSQDRSNFYEFAKLVNRYNGYVLASPWSPPAAWKSNNSVNGGGDLRESNYPDMAKYLDAFAKNMYNNGAPIYAVTLQNEPTYTAGYDGCEYTPEQNQVFFEQNKRFILTPGYGGGKALPRVLQVPGESHNELAFHGPVLRYWSSRDYVDFICRHIYGASTSTLPLATDPRNWSPPPGAGWQMPTSRIPTDADALEVWMTEHNLNSNSAPAYPNDSTWNYVWKFMNDIDFVIRVNEESAFVWWSSKRFYSMIGDGQYGTIDGVVYPRGYGLSHYAKFAKETGRVGVSISGITAGRTPISSNTATSIVNPSVFTSGNAATGIDSTAVKITAFVKTKLDRSNLVEIDPQTGVSTAHPNGWRLNRNNLSSSDLSEIVLVMWTPTDTSGSGGHDMGTVKVQLPTGFVISNAEAIRSNSTLSGRGDYMQPETVQIDESRNAAYISLPRSNIVSVRFTNAN